MNAWNFCSTLVHRRLNLRKNKLTTSYGRISFVIQKHDQVVIFSRFILAYLNSTYLSFHTRTIGERRARDQSHTTHSTYQERTRDSWFEGSSDQDSKWFPTADIVTGRMSDCSERRYARAFEYITEESDKGVLPYRSVLLLKQMNEWTDDSDTVGKTLCAMCKEPIKETNQGTTMMFLCRHVVHGTCVTGTTIEDNTPTWQDKRGRGISGRILS